MILFHQTSFPNFSDTKWVMINDQLTARNIDEGFWNSHSFAWNISNNFHSAASSELSLLITPNKEDINQVIIPMGCR